MTSYIDQRRYGLSIKTPAVSDLACFNKFIDTEDLSTDHNTTVYGDTQYGQYNPNQMYPSTPSQRGGAAYAGAGSPATLMYRDSSSKPSKSGRPSRPLSSYGQGIAFDGSDQTQAAGGGGGGGGGDGGGSIGNKGSTDSGGGGGGSSSAQYQASNAESSNIRGRSGSGVVKMPSRLQRAHSIMSPTRPGRSNTLTSTGSSSSGPAFHRRSSIAQVRKVNVCNARTLPGGAPTPRRGGFGAPRLYFLSRLHSADEFMLTCAQFR